ncbi:MAG TPA: GNAT family N-acetyltransferase [Solirubrobacteraceae bacterium]|nr:GNAT family N-acetyltransferase [Solirubrobacteraceae bacterium]
MAAVGDAQLDNPIYAALGGPHARFARVRGRARRYRDDVAPFFALPPEPSEQDWRDAAGLFDPGTYAAVWLEGSGPPEGWRAVTTFELVQMVGEQVTGAACPAAIRLAAADVPEMLELVTETEPGPFLARTVELGDYLGIRDGGELVAMAGERFRVEGWTEISAVCTRPGHRGQGLASKLIGALVAGIQARSEGVFLHVLQANTTAIRLYEELGFRIRLNGTITVVGPDAVGGGRSV